MQREAPSKPKDLKFFKPAITGGLFLGALSTLPLLNLGNCLCCLWIQGGGGIAAWLLNKQRPGTLNYGDGALVGLLSGLVGAVVYSLVNIPVEIVMSSPAALAQLQLQLDELSKQLPDLTQELKQSIIDYFAAGVTLSHLLGGLIMFSIIGGLFAMIGGILGVGLLKKQKTRANPTAGSPSA